MDIIIPVIIGIISRLAPHPPNLTAVGALSLFAGAKYSLKKALVITLSTMLISDIFLGLHSVMWATYGSLLLTIFIGRYIQKKSGALWILGGALSSSVLFYLITNFAVWLSPNFMYPGTAAGLIECYVLAIPFFRNTITGNVIYAAIFFAGYEWVSHFIKGTDFASHNQ